MLDIKLYGYSTSPFVQKVACYLYYKKLPFEFVPVNVIDQQELAFTGQTQVPVLKVNEEWRIDSTPLGIWLDEQFPDKPLLGFNDAEREKVIAIDRWVTDGYIAAIFRTMVDSEMDLTFRHKAWRLAAIVSSQTPLPEAVRVAWPEDLRSVPFVHDIANSMDRNELIEDMYSRLGRELLQHLQEGPYLGGLKQPSLADFSLYPQLIFRYCTGVDEGLAVPKNREIYDWLQRMSQHLPANPLLVPDIMLLHKSAV